MPNAPLLDLAIEAHGGIDAWQRLKGLTIDLTIGATFWPCDGSLRALDVFARWLRQAACTRHSVRFQETP
jgi:hypothetical protein